MVSRISAPRQRGACRSRLLASTVLTAVSLHCGGALAQQSASPSVELPTIVVSPTGVPTPVNQVANSITVITAEDIEREQRRTVPDVLQTVPGLNVVQAGGPGAQTSVFMRGTNSNHVKVLVDGIDVSDPSNANRTFDFAHLLTGDIERIEVLRGPQSGLYGADAIGGVISVITKKGEGPPKATVMIEGGSMGTFNQNAGLSGATTNFNYALNIAHFRSTDIPVTPFELLPPGRRAIDNWYDNTTYSTKLGANVSENVTLNSVVRYTDAKLKFTGDEFDFVTGTNVPAAAQSTQIVHQLFTRQEAVVSLFEDRFTNYFGVNYTNDWNWIKSPDPALPNVVQGDRTKFDYRGVVRPVAGLTLIGGAEHDTETLQNATISPVNFSKALFNAENSNKALWGEMQAENGRVFLAVNGRVDENESFGTHPTFRIAPGAILPFTDTKIKMSFGTGFKAPSLNQLFVDLPEFNFVANPNLRPEQNRGVDAGFEQPLFNDRVRFGATYFHNNITDIINFFFDPVTFVSTVINIDRATTEGVEAFASVSVAPGLRLRADYTYTNAVNSLTNEQLLRRPRNKTSVSAIWTPLDRLTVQATTLFVGQWADVDRATFVRVTQPGFTVVNLAANYAVDDRLTVFGRIDNLFDERYEDPNGFLNPRFGIYGGFRVSSR